MTQSTTHGVRIEVESAYVPERSAPEQDYYFFAYRVRISNVGEETVQLLSRHWVITDGDSKVEEVRGPGVIGEQPVLEPGQAHEYTSACPLRTQVGTMHGSYQMVSASGESFDAEIAPFTLALPNVLN
ncbi:MAG: Co2+/Mg2+ efflux protein ApaG [Myxococcota bacterium]